MIRAEIRLPKAYISVSGKPDLSRNSAIRMQYGRIRKFCIKLHRFCALFFVPGPPVRGMSGQFSDEDLPPAQVRAITGISRVRGPVHTPPSPPSKKGILPNAGKRKPGSEDLFSPHQDAHNRRDHKRNNKDRLERKRPAGKRDIAHVHPVETGNHRGDCEDDRDRGQKLHHDV